MKVIFLKPRKNLNLRNLAILLGMSAFTTIVILSFGYPGEIGGCGSEDDMEAENNMNENEYIGNEESAEDLNSENLGVEQSPIETHVKNFGLSVQKLPKIGNLSLAQKKLVRLKDLEKLSCSDARSLLLRLPCKDEYFQDCFVNFKPNNVKCQDFSEEAEEASCEEVSALLKCFWDNPQNGQACDWVMWYCTSCPNPGSCPACARCCGSSCEVFW